MKRTIQTEIDQPMLMSEFIFMKLEPQITMYVVKDIFYQILNCIQFILLYIIIIYI